MDDDRMSDPRNRAKRGRGRGGRGRGRGRGGTPAPTSVRKPPDLGNNAYRFEERAAGSSDEEDAYDAGVDFAEAAAAAGGVQGDAAADAQDMGDDALGELIADFSALDAVLASAPQWVRLGEASRFALGVPESVGWDDLIEDVSDETVTTGEDQPEGSGGLLNELGGLGLEDEESADTGSPEKDTIAKPAPVAAAGDDFDKWLDDL